jgi:3-phosphoshikimate 1-carboxyvinyltransferase|tara:strand:- start:717 stop:2063 length:1347 start_codon:yes stop_codon:yes gene_type:complete
MSSKSFTVSLKSKIKSFKRIINVDPDKSLSIRSFLIGSICQKVSIADNILESEDIKSSILACRKLGIKIIRIKPQKYKIYGKGLGSFYAKKNTQLNFGNSGTLARLLIGILSTTPNIEVNIKGDHSLNKRNMKEIIKLMSKFGASFLPKNKFKFPLKLISTSFPIGINFKAGVSAQIKSAVMLAGLNSFGNTNIIEEEKSRNHTENLLKDNTRAIKIFGEKKKIIKIYGKKYLDPIHVNIPGDISSSAFFAALTLLNQNSSIKIRDVGLNPTRTGFYQLLKKHNAKIKFMNLKKKNNELRGDIMVQSSKIKPIQASKKYYVNSTDEYPILFVIAALTKGISVFNGIGDLKNKESNRIKEMQKILKQIGVKTVAYKNNLKIFGKGIIDASNKKINVPNLGDHRICMSSFILSILTGAKTKIKNFETVYTSSPSFLNTMKKLGAKFEIEK